VQGYIGQYISRAPVCPFARTGWQFSLICFEFDVTVVL